MGLEIIDETESERTVNKSQEISHRDVTEHLGTKTNDYQNQEPDEPSSLSVDNPLVDETIHELNKDSKNNDLDTFSSDEDLDEHFKFKRIKKSTNKNLTLDSDSDDDFNIEKQNSIVRISQDEDSLEKEITPPNKNGNSLNSPSLTFNNMEQITQNEHGITLYKDENSQENFGNINNIEEKTSNKSGNDIISDIETEVKSNEKDFPSESDKEYNDDYEVPKKLTQKKPARLKKNELKEMKSEQQRLLRERRFEIPYHEPQAKSVKEFLQRVPTLKNQRTKSLPSTTKSTIENSGNSEKKQKWFDMKPKLQQNDEIAELEFIIEDIPDVKCQATTTRVNHFDRFLKKVQKQMVVKKAPLKDKAERCDDSSLIPKLKPNSKRQNIRGNCHTQLKSKLKDEMRKSRQQQYTELQSQREKLQEQIDLEEESCDEDHLHSEDDSEYDEDSDNEEVDKWNIDDERIRIEESMTEDNSKGEEKTNNDDVATAENDEEIMNDENIDFHRSLQEDDGKPRHNTAPLLKSSLLDNSCDAEEKKPLLLPCENTQDLYKNESRVSSQDSDSETELGPNFRLSLDEDTLMTQSLLDSQGFLKTNRNEKHETVFASKKPLFSDDLKETESMSMTQMLGLCSGKFNDDDDGAPTTVDTPLKKDDFKNFEMTESFSFDYSNRAMSFEGSLKTSSTTVNLSQALKEAKREAIQSDSGGQNKKTGQTSCNDNGEQVDETLESKTDARTETDEATEEKEDHDNEDGVSDDEEGAEGVSDDDDNDDEVATVDDEDADENADEDAENEQEEDVPEELKEWNTHVANDKDAKPKWKKQAFYEDEAELSGSDVGSDDEDLGSEYDDYEVDLEAEQDVISGDKLKRQLHKIHQLKMNDKDKHEMRLLQELYLEDGEFGGGEKRTRNFRWRNIDENFNENSRSNEIDEADNYSEMKEKNEELLQRNKFLMERDGEEKPLELDENSQMILDKIHRSTGGLIETSSSQPIATSNGAHVQTSKVAFRRSGSFLRGSDLSQNQSSLPVSKPLGKSAKSFVYQSMEETKTKKIKKKAIDSENILPPSKKAKLESDLINRRRTAPSSIFSHLK